MSRRSQQQLLEFESRLSPRRRRLIEAVAELRLMTGDQLGRLVDSTATPISARPSASRARLLRLDLAALTEDRCLHRLDRRIGGVRSGSAGYVYALGPVGLRLIELWSGHGVAAARTRYEPSVGFQDHALAVAGCVIDTVAAARLNNISVSYAIERRAWRRHLGPSGEQRTLKPDAEVALQAPDYADHWWLEIDRATERRAAIRRQLTAYVDYYRTGIEQQRGVFPLIGWFTTTETRAVVLREVIATLPADGEPLFRVGLLREAARTLLDDGETS